MRKLGIFGALIVALTSAFAAGSVPAPLGQVVGGPDIPTVTPPAAILHPFADERFTCTQSPRRHQVAVPDIDFNRVMIEVTITPDGDPWDRLYGVAIDGVEVIRGTTPRTKMTVRKDITEYARLLPRGGTADVSLMLGTYVGDMLGSVSLEFYSNEPTAPLVDAPADVRGAFLWSYLDTSPASAIVTFPASTPASASVEFTCPAITLKKIGS